jgi:hypothetical protein
MIPAAAGYSRSRWRPAWSYPVSKGFRADTIT